MRFDCFTLRAYIVISVRRAAIDTLRRRGREGELFFGEDSFLDTLASEEQDAGRALLREADSQQLYLAVGMLKQRQRDLLNMKYFLNLSDEEIAATYGLKAASIRSLISRARRELAEKMKRAENEQR